VTAELSQFDRRLLAAVERSVPLLPRPYGHLAARLGVGERELVARLAALSGPGGIIREISGVFDAPALGYASTLVAAECDPARLDEAGAAVSAHPGISHCYGREGRLNLWFTLTVPGESRLGLTGTVGVLAGLAGARRALSLPARRRYKLDVRFWSVGGREASPARRGEPARPSGAGPNAVQIRAIRALQKPLPPVIEPFAALARSAGTTAEELLVHAADFLAVGWMRRYGAVLRHRAAGARVNVLVAWRVPPNLADAFGAQAARFRAVSHCYRRAAAEDWPYNVYTMIHAGTAEQAESVVAAVAASAGDFPRVALPTAREYKKARVKLFSPGFARWESAHA